jgi:hypothetical protein
VRDERSFMLSLDVDAITDGASWAEWEALGDALARRLPGRTLEAVAEQYQERLLERVCGRRWHPERGLPAPFACPRQNCGATSDFARKGRRSRRRVLDTSIGTLRLRLANVICRACERVFAPLLVLLDLYRVRRTDRLMLGLAELGTQMSFARTAEVADQVGAMPASAGAAHTSLADVAGLLGDLPPADTRPQVVLLDGTGARAGADKLGVGVNLAVGLVGRGGPLRRRRAHTVGWARPWTSRGRRWPAGSRRSPRRRWRWSTVRRPSPKWSRGCGPKRPCSVAGGTCPTGYARRATATARTQPGRAPCAPVSTSC